MVMLLLLIFIVDPQATESTSTTEASPSLMMSFLGDLVPYFHTTASEEERDDKTVVDSAATLVDGDGGEIVPRDTGSQAVGQIHPQIRRRLGYAADGHRIRWVEVADTKQAETGRQFFVLYQMGANPEDHAVWSNCCIFCMF